MAETGDNGDIRNNGDNGGNGGNGDTAVAKQADRMDKVLKFATTDRFEDFHRYKKGRRIGSGSFGVVYEYVLNDPKEGLPEVIAVKILHEDTGEEPDSTHVLCVLREVNVTGDCDHHCIVKCYGICEVDGATALVLELCQGNLASFVKKTQEKRLYPDQILHVLLQIAAALCYLKSLNIIHRDLKPQNILLRDFGKLLIRLSDFGLAKVSTASKVTKAGTPVYSAPEMLKEDGLDSPSHIQEPYDKGHPSDVYSLGVLGFELATGERPPLAKDEATVTGWVKKKAQVIKDWKLRDFLLSCVKWRPEDRIPKERLLLHPYLLLQIQGLDWLLFQAEVLPGGLKQIEYTDDSGTKQEHIAIETLIPMSQVPQNEPVFNTSTHVDSLVPVIGTVASKGGNLVIITEKPKNDKTLGGFLKNATTMSTMNLLAIMLQLLNLGIALEKLPGKTYIHSYQLIDHIFIDPLSMRIQALLPRATGVDLQALAQPFKRDDPYDFCKALAMVAKMLRTKTKEGAKLLADIEKVLSVPAPGNVEERPQLSLLQESKDLILGFFPKIDLQVSTFITHVIDKRHLLCGQYDGHLTLIDLEKMEVVSTEKPHSDWINCISSNSKFFLCGSQDGDASLWNVPNGDAPTLSLVKKLPKPLDGEPIWACSMNETHLAIGRSGTVQVFTATESPELVSKIDTCGSGCGPKSVHMVQPSGNGLWARAINDIVLYEDGEEKKKLSIGERAKCLSPSSDGRTVWAGTWNGNLFSCDAASGKVTDTPVRLEGEQLTQIEEAEGGRKLIIYSEVENKTENSFLTVVSTEDEYSKKERVFPDKQWISYFSLVNDIIIFGHSKSIKFAPV